MLRVNVSLDTDTLIAIDRLADWLRRPGGPRLMRSFVIRHLVQEAVAQIDEAAVREAAARVARTTDISEIFP